MKLTIGKQLASGFGAVIALMAVSAAFAYFKLAEMNRIVGTVVDESFPLVRACDELLSGLANSLAALRGYLLLVDDPRQADMLKQHRQSAWNDMDDAVRRLEALYEPSTDEQGRRTLAGIQAELRQFRAIQDRVEAEGAVQNNQAIQLLSAEAVPKATQVREALEGLKAAAATRVREDRNRLVAAGTAVSTMLLTVTLITMAVAAGLAFTFSRRMVRSIQSLLSDVQTVAGGNLTGTVLRIHAPDEIGQLAASFSTMVTSLRELIAEAGTMTGEVAAASSEIATASQQQVASLNQTATSLNQITTTAEEFKTAMQEFADRAGAVQEAANEMAKRAGEGRTLTVDSTARIEQVRTNSQAAATSVLNLSEQMQRIGEITATVNEIAEQTKLLALNASIEAARAGDEGRGFAVVATQVRELANQSKASASRIESLIAETQKSVREVVHNIEEGGRLSVHSSEIVSRVTHAFDEISQAIEQTRNAMSQINLGARQQEQGIRELVSGISEIDSAMKESLAAAEQTQKSIVAIDQRIRALNQSMSRFKT